MSPKMEENFVSVNRSLTDLLGHEYIEAVCNAKSYFDGSSLKSLRAIADQQVEFYSTEMQARADELLDSVGTKVSYEFPKGGEGAPSASFRQASQLGAAPLAGFGPYRIGEDGRLYLAAKSEHYHASLGHSFPGYRLIDNARKLGIPNATHNNTRGYIQRRLEREIIRIANGIPVDAGTRLDNAIATDAPHILNRVINLQTGSLAVEAAAKMMLSRFYNLDNAETRPKYAGRKPVFFVIADEEGGRQANYHGTTVLTQVMRGLWPQFSSSIEVGGMFTVVPVRMHDIDDFRSKLVRYNIDDYKVAGFFHEIVLMNYGGILIGQEYLADAYELCRKYDVPVCVDEIQSCGWFDQLFLFKQYGLKPDFVAVGKGLSGGEYAASKIIATAEMDNLTQFGALVTNGQEELAALAYLVTIEFAKANDSHTRSVGEYYHSCLEVLQSSHSRIVSAIEGKGHLSTLFFHNPAQVVEFCRRISRRGIDISAHTYKPKCPPAALTKLPVVTSRRAVDFIVDAMQQELVEMSGSDESAITGSVGE